MLQHVCTLFSLHVTIRLSDSSKWVPFRYRHLIAKSCWLIAGSHSRRGWSHTRCRVWVENSCFEIADAMLYTCVYLPSAGFTNVDPGQCKCWTGPWLFMFHVPLFSNSLVFRLCGMQICGCPVQPNGVNISKCGRVLLSVCRQLCEPPRRRLLRSRRASRTQQQQQQQQLHGLTFLSSLMNRSLTLPHGMLTECRSSPPPSVVPRLYHLFLLSLSTLLGTLSFT